MALYQLIYMSSLVTDDPQVLPAILATSARHNKSRGITGILLCAAGRVIQVLEGERDSVLDTFTAIRRDSRHTGLFVVLKQEIPVRQFAAWSMGFKQLSNADLEKYPPAAHVFRASRNELMVRGSEGVALTVLRSFAYDTMDIV